MSTIRIKAALLNIHRLILFKDDGEEITINQGDKRLSPILEFINDPLQAQGFVDLPVEYLDAQNIFQEYEKQSKFLRFFKVSKNLLKKLFTHDHLIPRVIGDSDFIDAKEKTNKVSPTVLKEIMDSADKASSTNFTRDIGEASSEKTIVAITEDGSMIPEAHLMSAQINHALDYKNAKGFENFLKRLKPIISERGHTIEELLKFMEKGDLPLADDGSIIAYKLLFASGDHFVDPHTRRVKQKVGSYVHMLASKVDNNRRNECSNGLHVARRGYLRGFSGDTCFIIKVAPEDVIAVPQYDADKMRVCGYHILFQLTSEMKSKLQRNAPITDQEDGQIILGKAIVGDHTKKLESVFISGQQGNGLVITPYDENEQPIVEKPEGETEAEPTATPKVSEPVKTEEEPKKVVKVTAIADNQMKVTSQTAKPIGQEEIQKMNKANTNKKVNTRAEEARKLFDLFEKASATSADRKARIQALQSFKQSKKVSWEVLGFTKEEEKRIKKTIENLLK